MMWRCLVEENVRAGQVSNVGRESEHMSRSLTIDSISFSLFMLFYSLAFFSFIFLFLEQLGLGAISHAVTSVTT